MSATLTKTWRLGLLGAGAFGRFCLQQFQKMEQVQPVAVADVNLQFAQAAAGPLGLEACGVDELLSREDVEVIHIATPPATHRDLAVRALEAGKHILCEKPLATTMADAQAIVAVARQVQRIAPVNLIMRYNPLCEAVERIIHERLLGEPLHAYFENYAKDEPLPPTHWFWNKSISGGIFIEHGVHFFDLFAMWFGPGRVVAAQRVIRPHTTDMMEQVQCSALYGDDPQASAVLTNFYHGFHQPARLDRQEIRIVCERGDLRLYEWVPTRVEIDCLATHGVADQLDRILPDATRVSEDALTGDARHMTGRHKPIDADARYRFTSTAGMEKTDLYNHVIAALLTDQLAAAEDPSHQRRVTEDNGLTSLQMAVTADELAASYR